MIDFFAIKIIKIKMMMQAVPKGFSIPELVMVIVVIGIISVFVSNRWPGTDINLQAQTEQLAADIQYAQLLAMNTGNTWGRINFSATEYSITNRSNVSHFSPLWGSAINLASDITLSSTVPFVVFNALGQPFTDANFNSPLTANAVIILTSGTLTRQITITPETGKVNIV